MIQLHDLCLAYGERRLLDNANATFDRGTLTALIGRNGSGKSTLLRAIAALNRRYTGTIAIDGTDTLRLNASEMARLLAVVTTERVRIGNFSCRDVVATGRAPYTNWTGRLSAADNAIVDEAIATAGIEQFASRSISTLSDGEAQRVMIARAIAQQTPVMLLDEPTSFLDLPSRRHLAALLRRLATETGRCIIFSTHELDLATEFATSIALIDHATLTHLPTSQALVSTLLDPLLNPT
ncbi:MAG: ABC transporter ATP-binding protein [Muribaculaceae bacterium]|nr:ABC transporter ATP-binding protein [Muribaculaceae bacterium]